jgi:hypothetical protein
MAIDYSIKAIPTIYNGVQYRSRLEARWAAMLTLLGWEHQYEPYDLGGWSPDFLTGPRGCEKILVEVKPIEDFDLGTATRMAGACRENEIGKMLMLVGVQPFVIKHRVRLGWVGWSLDRPDGWEHDPVMWGPIPGSDEQGADIVLTSNMEGTPFRMFAPEYSVADLSAMSDHTMGLWAKATNAVQWHRK